MQRVSARVALCWLALVLTGGARAAENLQPLTVASSELRAATATAVATSGGGGVAAGRLLANGFPAQFTMSAVTPFSPGNFYNGDNGFSVIVPPGAGRLEVALTTSPEVDVVLYLRYGTDVAISGGAPVYDKSSEGTGGSTTLRSIPAHPCKRGPTTSLFCWLPRA